MFEILKKTFQLTNISKQSFFKYFIVSLLSSFIELFGVGLIIVFIGFLISENFYEKIPYIEELPFYSQSNSDELFIFFCIIIFFVFVIRFFISIWLKFYESKFKKKLTIDLVSKTLETYLNQDFEWFVNKGSNRLIVNIIENCRGVIDVIIVRFFSALNSSVMLLVFILSVIFIDFFLVSMIILMMAIASISVYKIFSIKNKKIGEKMYLYYNVSYSFLKSALESFPVVKVLKKKNYFLKNFDDNFSIYQHQIFEYEIIREVTRILFEFLFIFTICSSMIIGHINGSNFINIEYLIFYSLVFMRSLPHITTLLSFYRDIKKAKPQLDAISDIEFIDEENKPEIISSFKKMEFKKISYKYLNNLDFKLDISFEINKGDKIAIIGMSGSGKTTLANIIMGLAKAESGDIRVDGDRLSNQQLNFISYVPQHSFIVNDSFIKNISLSLKKDNKKEILDIIKKTSLDYVFKRYHNQKTNLFGSDINLSGGELQRLSIARGLFLKPELLVLDEPTSNLDSINENRFLETLNKFKEEISVVMITHKISLIKDFKKIIFLNKGKVLGIGGFNYLYKNVEQFRKICDYQEIIYE